MLTLIWIALLLRVGGENTTFHRCYDEGEAYAASFLTTTKHIKSRELGSYSAKKITTELASFVMIETRQAEKRLDGAGGAMIRTRDMLDFCVIHVSAMERTHRMERKGHLSGPLLRNLKKLADDQRARYGASNSHSKTLAIMPWVGTAHARDVGNSDVSNRRIYLEASFWSVVRTYQHVVIGCCFKEDVETIRSLKLPVVDVLYFPDCQEEPQKLPFMLLKETQRQLQRREDWDSAFEYVFYTESDQLPLVREPGELQVYLNAHPSSVLLPHRLIPYSSEVINGLLGTALLPGLDRRLPRLPRLPLHKLTSSPWRCCLPTASCSGNHTAMVPLKRALRSSTVPMLNVEGMLVVMGTANFWLHKFRLCQFQRREEGMCPESLMF